MVTQLYHNLMASPLFKLDKNERLVVRNRTPQNDKEWAFDYEMQLTLAKPQPTE